MPEKWYLLIISHSLGSNKAQIVGGFESDVDAELQVAKYKDNKEVRGMGVFSERELKTLHRRIKLILELTD